MIARVAAGSHATLLKRGFAALKSGDLATAEECCRRVLNVDPKIPQAHFLVGLIALETNNRKIAANAFHTVTKLDAKNTAAWAHLAKLFSELGYTLRADEALTKAEETSTDNPTIQNVIGAVCTMLGEHEKAESWYAKASANEPNNAAFSVNLANAKSFNGRTQEAERTIAKILAVHPDNPQAHWILAGLRKAENEQHAVQMETLAKQYESQPHPVAFLSYGAGKEYEDIEAWTRAFPAFERGARARRKTVNYDEREEENMFAALAETYTKEWLENSKSEVENDAPVFIVGQPRTGTTLIERIITSHPEVASAGELQQFYLSIRRLSKVLTPARMSRELAHAAAELDPSQLGRTYIAATIKHSRGKPRFVDKMPVNYLYAPLIARALPNAKVIHIVRDPMDSCYSSFKQLFADAYPHSYCLEEMARHHLRYFKLMKQWRDILGERMLDVSYEETVSDLEFNARRMIAFLGLDWEDECLDFHKQSGAVSTASAVQVRMPVHRRSVGRWRRYEAQLQPVAKILSASGIKIM